MNPGPHDNTRNIVVLAICTALFHSGRALAFIAGALVAISMLGDDLTLVTAPLTMMLVGTAAGTLPVTYVMQRYGRKAGFVSGSMVGTVGSVVCALAISADDFLVFNLGLFLFGLYNGAAQQYRFAVADAAPEDRKAKAVSIVIAMGVVGAFVGPEATLLTKNVSGLAEFEGPFWVLAGFCFLSGIIVLWIDIPKLPISRHGNRGRPLREIFVIPTFLVAVVAALFGYSVMNLVMTATPVTMQVDSFTDHHIARVIQWHVVAMFAPGFFTGTLIRRTGTVRVIVLGSALLLGSVLIALAGNSFPYYFWALVFLGLGWNFTFTGGTVLVTEVHNTSEEMNKVQGMNDFILFTGLAISALSAGVIYHHFGWIWVNLSALPLILAVLFSAVWLRSIRKKSRAD
ncbi:MAG: MFS transporter [Gammaproteobacteria bacterium]|nr:MFS transporter [Gammaproteobacteria bacterium]